MNPQEFPIVPNDAYMQHPVPTEPVEPVEAIPADIVLSTPDTTEQIPGAVTDGAEFMTTDPTEVEAREGWFKRNLTKLCLGAAVVGATVSLITNPYQEILDKLKNTASWAIPAGLVSEGIFIGGLALMAVSAGTKIGNPLKLRGRFNEIAKEAADSRTFRAGFTINAIGALASAGVVAAGVVSSLPVETWPGGLGLAAADIAGTLALRAGMMKGVKNSRERTEREQ